MISSRHNCMRQSAVIFSLLSSATAIFLLDFIHKITILVLAGDPLKNR